MTCDVDARRIPAQVAAAASVDLDTFGAGLTYTFPAATLAPGARLVLVRNAAAFSARYGAGVIVFTYLKKGAM